MIEIDFGDVQEQVNLDAGLYRGTISKIELGDSRSTPGQKVINVEFALNDTNGRKLWETFSLQSNALWRLKEFLVGLGFEVPQGPFQFPDEEVLGMEVEVQVAIEPHWQNSQKMVPKVVKVSRAEGADWG